MIRPEPFDSATRTVREVAAALTATGLSRGRGILEAYPPGAAPLLRLIKFLPEGPRLRLIERGISWALGRRRRRPEEFNPATLPVWCTSQYPKRGYQAVLIGSPGGGTAHLAALLWGPFLTSSFLLSFRRARGGPDDLKDYAHSSERLAEQSLAGLDPDLEFEAIAHYDPLHDRPLVRAAVLLRLRLIRLPESYRGFILEGLTPGGHLILINCTYPWPQYRLGRGSFLQVGGLGGLSPDEFLKRWSLDLPKDVRPESEWGCPPELVEDVKRFARERDFKLIELRFHHPREAGLLAYRAYLAAGARPEELMLDCFTYINPYTNLITGIPALWLPYNDRGSLEFTRRFLEGKRFKKVYLTLVPSFSRCEDIPPLAEWMALLWGRGELKLLGPDPRAYPADPWAPFAYRLGLIRLKNRYPSRSPLHLRPEMLPGLTKELEYR